MNLIKATFAMIRSYIILKWCSWKLKMALWRLDKATRRIERLHKAIKELENEWR